MPTVGFLKQSILMLHYESERSNSNSVVLNIIVEKLSKVRKTSCVLFLTAGYSVYVCVCFTVLIALLKIFLCQEITVFSKCYYGWNGGGSSAFRSNKRGENKKIRWT